jgi:pyruvate/2-oxoglutarate dehydrogenase complex dihydrolipoamide dehydrogenase (E3) component
VTAFEGGWLYAAGDVNGRVLLMHQGKYQARLVGDIIAGRQRTAWADHTAVPQVMFTDPELAAEGCPSSRPGTPGST